MTTLDQLEALAKAVYGPSKDDWELKQALHAFDKAANPATILALIALVRQQHEALRWCKYEEDGFVPKMDEALAAFENFGKE